MSLLLFLPLSTKRKMGGFSPSPSTLAPHPSLGGAETGAFVHGGWPVLASRSGISCFEKPLLLLVAVSHRRGLRLLSPWSLAYGLAALTMLGLGLLWLLPDASGGGYDCRMASYLRVEIRRWWVGWRTGGGEGKWYLLHTS